MPCEKQFVVQNSINIQRNFIISILVYAIATNVFGLGEGGEKKALKFKFSTKANRKYKCSA